MNRIKSWMNLYYCTVTLHIAQNVSELLACPALAIVFTSLHLTYVKTAVATRRGACFANRYGVHSLTRPFTLVLHTHFKRALFIYRVDLPVTKSSSVLSNYSMSSRSPVHKTKE